MELRAAEAGADEADVAAEDVELLGEGGGDFQPVDGFLDFVEPLQRAGLKYVD